MVSRHRSALGAVLLGNVVVFAGVDPPTRLATAAVVLLLVVDLRRSPKIPRSHRIAAVLVAGLVAVQLVPLPEAVRSLLQPGFAEPTGPSQVDLEVEITEGGDSRVVSSTNAPASTP